MKLPLFVKARQGHPWNRSAEICVYTKGSIIRLSINKMRFIIVPLITFFCMGGYQRECQKPDKELRRTKTAGGVDRVSFGAIPTHGTRFAGRDIEHISRREAVAAGPEYQ